MINEKLYLKEGTLLLNGYNRVVHGQRGDYIEFEFENIQTNLTSYYNLKSLDELINKGYYYQWLYPNNLKDIKIYYQLKTVKYADYKIGKYYISPEFILDFKDPEKLF